MAIAVGLEVKSVVAASIYTTAVASYHQMLADVKPSRLSIAMTQDKANGWRVDRIKSKGHWKYENAF